MIKYLSEAIKDDHEMLELLKQVRSLNLPDCWIGAGFVRNKAWDILHGYNRTLKLNDVDVVYFDKTKGAEVDKTIEMKLQQLNNKVRWEVVNQARTHKWHNRMPYKDTTEAISEWVETATCIGIRLTQSDELEFTTPHGTSDLENLILRPVASLTDTNILIKRVKAKKWLLTWPKLKIVI